MVPLTSDSATWRADIESVWIGFIDPAMPVHVTLLDPIVRGPTLHGRNAIIWQCPMPHRVVALEAWTDMRGATPLVHLTAHSVEDACRVHSLTDLAMHPDTNFRSVWYLGEQYALPDFLALYDGAVWTLDEEPAQHEDQIALLQLPKVMPPDTKGSSLQMTTPIELHRHGLQGSYHDEPAVWKTQPRPPCLTLLLTNRHPRSVETRQLLTTEQAEDASADLRALWSGLSETRRSGFSVCLPTIRYVQSCSSSASNGCHVCPWPCGEDGASPVQTGAPQPP